MSFAVVCSVVSMGCNLSAAVPYVMGIAKQQTKPHFITWLIWSITNGTGFVAQLLNGAGAGAWPTGLGMIICLGAALSGLVAGENTITRGDWLSLVFALAATPLWIATKNPLYAVILVTFIDLSGYYPTLRKSWMKPYDESLPAHVLGTSSQFFAIFAVEKMTMVNVFYPAVTFIPHLVLLFILITRRRVIKAPGAKTPTP